MINIATWATSDWISDSRCLALKDKNTDFFMRGIVLSETPEIRYVGIETINSCNNNCSFCPAGLDNDIRQRHRMTDELFYRIIAELKVMKYTGLLGLFNNDEPLLDKRIFDFIEYARANLPGATHYLFTNGILLNKDSFRRLTKSLDYLLVDNYNDKLQLMPNVRELVEDEILTSETDCFVQINVRKKTQVLSSRAGYAPNKKNSAAFHSPCMLPFFQFYIKPEGKVSVCCQDVYGGVPGGNHDGLIIADLNETSISEAWGNDKHRHIMLALAEQGRGCLDVCEKCDTFGFYNNFPPSYLHEYASTLIKLAWKRKKEGAKILLHGKVEKLSKINSLLEMNGLFADGIFSKDAHYTEDIFVVFSHYDFDLIFSVDPDTQLIGKKYIVFEVVEPLSIVYPKEKRVSFKAK